ncbi:MAG: hypothetical protein M1831_002710 [Alyxoria varia]|nr:MAG: hypothetical protein M1831_002710 [Alyxoria varia]
MDGVVIRSATTSSFVQRILNQRPRPIPTHIIICSERQVFLKQLHRSVTCEVEGQRPSRNQERLDSSNTRGQVDSASQHPLLQRTISQLSLARNVQLTFCASLPALLAFLTLLPKESDTTHSGPQTGVSDSQARTVDLSTSGAPILALVNPIELHRETTTFSAQGFSKTFAATVEAAVRGAQKLIIVECVDGISAEKRLTHVPQQSLSNENDDRDEPIGEPGVDSTAPSSSLCPAETPMHIETETDHEDANDLQGDPWMEDIPVLNPSTKTYGLASDERGGWLGRTVKIQDVASRWCRFESLNEGLCATRDAL